MSRARVISCLALLVVAIGALWSVLVVARAGILNLPIGKTVNLGAANTDIRATTGVLAGAIVLGLFSVAIAEVAKLSLISRHVGALFPSITIALFQLTLLVDALRVLAPDWGGAMLLALGVDLPPNYSVFEPRWPWPSTILVIAAFLVVAFSSRSGRATTL